MSEHAGTPLPHDYSPDPVKSQLDEAGFPSTPNPCQINHLPQQPIGPPSPSNWSGGSEVYELFGKYGGP